MNILMEGTVSEWQIYHPEQISATVLEELRKDIERDIRNFDSLKVLNVSFDMLDNPITFEEFAHAKRQGKVLISKNEI